MKLGKYSDFELHTQTGFEIVLKTKSLKGKGKHFADEKFAKLFLTRDFVYSFSIF